MRKGGIALLVMLVSAAAAAQTPDVAAGFYRDERGRLMQVSFDLQQRLWLGASYAPRRRASGREDLGPVAFDFGLLQEWYGPDGRTRHRLSILDGEARINPFGLDVTAVRYDLSHAYGFPLLRVTTLWAKPARHDLYLNVGVYGEAGRVTIEPLGEGGNHELTLASVQPTLDLWQSWDLRSYLRLRAGPVAHLRLGPWGDESRLVTALPETALEGSFILGRRALQQARFRMRAAWLRRLEGTAPRAWLVDGEASYEIVVLAINDQPVSLRFAGRVGDRDGDTHGLEWTATGGLRISFFSPPVVRSPRR